jgi:O-antigen ligase
MFLLTQGPVFQLWTGSANQLASLPLPSLGHVYFTTFISAQLPGIALWLRRTPTSWCSNTVNRAATAFVSWMLLSVLWSTFARQTLPEAVALAVTTLFGMYLATSFSLRRFLYVIVSATGAGVLASYVAAIQLWRGAVNLQEGYWVGIYLNRNSLAPVATLLILAVGGLLILNSSERRWLPPLAVPLIGLAAFSAFIVVKSESQTSPVALGITVIVCLVWLSLSGLIRGLTKRSQWNALVTPLVVALAAMSMFVLLRAASSSMNVSSEDATFNARSPLWSQSWAGILDKPLFGWGWMAAWYTPAFLKLGSWWATWNSTWSHNGYHDVVLGGGIVAATLFFIYLWLSLYAIGTRPQSEALVRLSMTVFVLVAATQESFFVGSHFLWAALVAATAPVLRHQQDSKHSTS